RFAEVARECHDATGPVERTALAEQRAARRLLRPGSDGEVAERTHADVIGTTDLLRVVGAEDHAFIEVQRDHAERIAVLRLDEEGPVTAIHGRVAFPARPYARRLRPDILEAPCAAMSGNAFKFSEVHDGGAIAVADVDEVDLHAALVG